MLCTHDKPRLSCDVCSKRYTPKRHKKRRKAPAGYKWCICGCAIPREWEGGECYRCVEKGVQDLLDGSIEERHATAAAIRLQQTDPTTWAEEVIPVT